MEELPVMKGEVAALDLDIPDNLLDESDRFRWSAYADAISPARLVSKFAEAVDQFYSITPANTCLIDLAEKDKEAIFSKWLALSTLGYKVTERLHYFTPEDISSELRSDMQESMYLLVDFLKAVDSPTAQDWEQRQRDYASIDRDKLLPLIDQMYERNRPEQPPGTRDGPN